MLVGCIEILKPVPKTLWLHFVIPRLKASSAPLVVMILFDLNASTGWHFLQGRGVQRGHLIGGCFEVLDWLRGTDFWPQTDVWRDAILFLGTSEDAPSPDVVKYGLRTYAALGILPRLSGLLFARPGGPVPPEKFEEYDQVLLQVVAEEAGLTDLPLITGMDFGHRTRRLAAVPRYR